MIDEGNPQADNMNDEEGVVNDVMASGSDNYFEQLERQVNGEIYDDAPKEEQVTPEASTQETQDSMEGSSTAGDWESDDNPYKKRYSDSSRENAKNQQIIESNSQYNALIDVMKKDPGLVDTVRGYLESGGQQSQKLPEDFIFDPDEAFADPSSTSAKVFTGAVQNIVDRAVRQSSNEISSRITNEKQEAAKNAEADAWRQANNMSEEDFAAMMDKATNHQISYDDINLILNGATVKKNVAKNTKKDVINQMKNVRKTPNTVSATGSADTTDITEEDQVFNAIKSLGADDLFG
jgi:translation initiation factor 2 beta subunit (eIF-2beta)/eIF-5